MHQDKMSRRVNFVRLARSTLAVPRPRRAQKNTRGTGGNHKWGALRARNYISKNHFSPFLMHSARRWKKCNDLYKSCSPCRDDGADSGCSRQQPCSKGGVLETLTTLCIRRWFEVIQESVIVRRGTDIEAAFHKGAHCRAARDRASDRPASLLHQFLAPRE